MIKSHKNDRFSGAPLSWKLACATASFALLANAQLKAQVQASAFLANRSLAQYDPVFMSVSVKNTGKKALDIGVFARWFIVERETSGSWIARGASDFEAWEGRTGIEQLSTAKAVGLGVGKDAWIEVMGCTPEFSSLTGKHRVRARIGWRVHGSTEPYQWVESTSISYKVTGSQRNHALAKGAGTSRAYKMLLRVGFSHRGTRADSLVGIPFADIRRMRAAAEPGGELQHLLAITYAEKRFKNILVIPDPKARTTALLRLEKEIASLDTGRYSGPVGGLGAHILYLRACVAWWSATRKAELARGNVYWSEIEQRYPAAKKAFRRSDVAVVRSHLSRRR